MYIQGYYIRTTRDLTIMTYTTNPLPAIPSVRTVQLRLTSRPEHGEGKVLAPSYLHTRRSPTIELEGTSRPAASSKP